MLSKRIYEFLMAGRTEIESFTSYNPFPPPGDRVSQAGWGVSGVEGVGGKGGDW